MDIVNPIAAALAQSTVVTRQQAADKSRQIRRAQVLKKDVAASSDSFVHKVESAEELAAIHDEPREQDGQQHPKQKPSEEEPHIDICG